MAQPGLLEGIVAGFTGLFDGVTGCQSEQAESRAGVPKSPEPRPSSAYGQISTQSSPTISVGARTGSLSRASSSSSNASADMAVFTTSTSFRGRPSRSPSVERASLSRGNSVGSARSGRSARSPSVEGSQVSRDKPKTGMAKALSLDDNKLYKAKWRSFELFKGLDEDDMQHCIDAMKVRSYNMGDTIIKRGTIGTTMFFIDLGTARAEIRGHTATELKSGDYFGEIAFTATCGKFLRDKSDKSPPEQAVRVADIKATSPCRMLELSVKDFLTILQDNGKEQNRQVLASLSRKCDERKANAQRIDDKQHREKCKERARDAWNGLGMVEASKR